MSKTNAFFIVPDWHTTYAEILRKDGWKRKWQVAKEGSGREKEVTILAKRANPPQNKLCKIEAHKPLYQLYTEQGCQHKGCFTPPPPAHHISIYRYKIKRKEPQIKVFPFSGKISTSMNPILHKMRNSIPVHCKSVDSTFQTTRRQLEGKLSTSI